MDRKQKVLADRDKIVHAEKLRTIGFLQVFGSANGIKVLKDIEIMCGADHSSAAQAEFDTNKTMFLEGKRRVWLEIKQILDRKVEENE